MASIDRHPPGRAGRTWLLGRIAAARRAAELLDRKRQLIQRELDDLAERRVAARSEWGRTSAGADTWGLRARLLGGEADVRLGSRALDAPALVEVPWAVTMGIGHPAAPRCTLPLLPASAAAAANAAVMPAAAAYRAALECAALLATLDKAEAVLRVELQATRRRQRAIEEHRLPALERLLAHLELRLDELERQERVVARWAARRPRPDPPGVRPFAPGDPERTAG